MIATLATKNVLIDALQETLSSKHQVDCVVVAHDDSALLKRLRNAFPEESTAILQVPQDTWSDTGTELQNLLEYAVNDAHAKRFIVAGSSSASNSDSASGGTHVGLMSRVKNAQGQRKQAEEAFVKAFEKFLSNGTAERMSCSGDVAVNGLFFRAESGIFASYDEQSSQLQHVA